MKSLFFKRAITAICIIAALGVGLFMLGNFREKVPTVHLATDEYGDIRPLWKVIGYSVEGRKIEAYTYLPAPAATKSGGTEKTNLLFVGGMHGGYEWNSVLLAYKFIDYLYVNPEVIPENLTVTVIPSANPDGLYKVTGKVGRFTMADVSTNKETLASGRFNAREVDLNRNFDCKWKPEGAWRGNTVSAGSAPFSEPEAAAIRNFVLENNPDAVIFWHSQSNAVYASECKAGILSKTVDIMNAYSGASGYPPVKSFDSYEVTGDAEGWLASINIPAITVELQTHETIEWERNLKGVKALFTYFE